MKTRVARQANELKEYREKVLRLQNELIKARIKSIDSQSANKHVYYMTLYRLLIDDVQYRPTGHLSIELYTMTSVYHACK